MSDVVGFVGLGRMGRGMATNLCRRGFRLVVNDVNRDAVDALEKHQARGAADIAEVAAASGIVVTMLPNSAVVTDVIAGPAGILAHARPGTLIMDMSTVSPETTDAMAAAARAAGMTFVDAPVGRLASHADRARACSWSAGPRPISCG